MLGTTYSAAAATSFHSIASAVSTIHHSIIVMVSGLFCNYY